MQRQTDLDLIKLGNHSYHRHSAIGRLILTSSVVYITAVEESKELILHMPGTRFKGTESWSKCLQARDTNEALQFLHQGRRDR
jgi:hypothetical protein